MPKKSVFCLPTSWCAAFVHVELSARRSHGRAHRADRARESGSQRDCDLSCPNWAREGARAVDAALARGEDPGPLAGLPVAHKDLIPTKGIRTTFGSPIFRDFVPDADAIIVERLQESRRGHDRENQHAGIRRRLPDLQSRVRRDAQSLRSVQDVRRQQRRRGGALACGMMPIADGSDLGGSLRNPASFCNVVGLRPSTGPRAKLAQLFGLVPPGGGRADGAHGAGRCPDAFGHCRPGRAFADLAAGTGSAVRAPAGAGLQGHAHRLECGSGRSAGRTGSQPTCHEKHNAGYLPIWAASSRTRRRTCAMRTRSSASCAPGILSCRFGQLAEDQSATR